MATPSQPSDKLSPAEKRNLLGQLLRKKAAQPRIYPLSFAQQRLWLLDQWQPGNPAYLIPLAMRIEGRLFFNVLERCLNELVRRHQSLRTTFGTSGLEPVQIVHPTRSFSLRFVDFSDLGSERETRQLHARQVLMQEQQQPCSLQDGPLWRAYLLRLDRQEHVLLLTFHHIISDGWSVQLFLRELGLCYQALQEGKPSPLPPLPLQYVDYAVWQRQWLQGEVLENLLSYWQRQLGGYSALQLPVDAEQPAEGSNRGAEYPFTLSLDLLNALTALGSGEGATLFMTLLTAFLILLYHSTGQTDLLLGTDIAQRMHEGTEGLIGFFVNVLVLRLRLDGMLSFRELLARVREMVLGAYAHQHIPFEVLARQLAPQQSMDRLPLVRCLFVLQNMPQAETAAPELKISPFQDQGASTAKFDLALFLHTGPLGVNGIVNYHCDLFQEKTISALMGRFEALLQQIVLFPEKAIDLLKTATDDTPQKKGPRKRLRLASAGLSVAQ